MTEALAPRALTLTPALREVAAGLLGTALGGAATALWLWVWRRLGFHRHREGLSRKVARALVANRTGGLHVFDNLRPVQTALLVIDMQDGFISKAHRDQPFYCPRGRAIVPAINRAAKTLRSLGGKVVWVTSDVGKDSLSSWDVLYGSFLPASLRSDLSTALGNDARRWGQDYNAHHCKHGMDGPLHEGLEVCEGDLCFKKDRFSPFVAGGKHQACAPTDGPCGPLDFAARLRQHGINTLLIAGVTTACCVSCTARDAMQLNFKVVVLSDGCAASVLQDHTAALDHLAYLMADVRTVDSALGMLEKV